MGLRKSADTNFSAVEASNSLRVQYLVVVIRSASAQHVRNLCPSPPPGSTKPLYHESTQRDISRAATTVS